MRRLLHFGGWLALCGSLSALAQSPEVKTVAPRAVLPGQAVQISVQGPGMAEVNSLWTSFAGEVRKEGTEESSSSFQVTSPPGLKPGLVFLQAISPKGISDYQMLVADPLPTQDADGKHHNPASAHPLILPAAVDGSTAANAIDYYKITAKAGEKIPVEVVAHRIGSQLDPVVRVLDSGGRELAWHDDGGGGTRDTQFEFTSPADGEYFLAVHDVGYAGSKDHFYRLRAGTAFVPGFPFLSSSSCATGATNGQVLEPLPVRIQAVLQEGGPHRFSFQAEKDQKLIFQTATREIGSPCDLLLRLLQGDGSQLAESDSAKPGDAALTNQFSSAGRYTVEVHEITGRPIDCAYELAVEPFTPGVQLSAESNRLTVEPGGTASLKIAATRYDFEGPVALEIEGLPEGFGVENTTLAEKKNETELKIKAPGTAQPGEAFHFRVRGKLPDLPAAAGVSTRPALRKSFPLMLHLPEELDGLFALSIKASEEK